MEEVVCQDAHEQPGLVGCESMASRLIPTQCVLSFFDPVLNVATTVVHLDYLPGSELGIGHNESDPWEEFPGVAGCAFWPKGPRSTAPASIALESRG